MLCAVKQCVSQKYSMLVMIIVYTVHSLTKDTLTTTSLQRTHFEVPNVQFPITTLNASHPNVSIIRRFHCVQYTPIKDTRISNIEINLLLY